jgi:hypothetical protein
MCRGVTTKDVSWRDFFSSGSTSLQAYLRLAPNQPKPERMQCNAPTELETLGLFPQPMETTKYRISKNAKNPPRSCRQRLSLSLSHTHTHTHTYNQTARTVRGNSLRFQRTQLKLADSNSNPTSCSLRQETLKKPMSIRYQVPYRCASSHTAIIHAIQYKKTLNDR